PASGIDHGGDVIGSSRPQNDRWIRPEPAGPIGGVGPGDGGIGQDRRRPELVTDLGEERRRRIDPIQSGSAKSAERSSMWAMTASIWFFDPMRSIMNLVSSTR